MDGDDAPRLQQGPILGREPDAVGGVGPAAESTQLIEPLRRGQAIFIYAVLLLRRRLRQVDVHTGPPLLGLLGGGPDHPFRAGVFRMDGEIHRDPPVTRPVPPIVQGQHLLHPAAGHGVLAGIEGLERPA